MDRSQLAGHLNVAEGNDDVPLLYGLVALLQGRKKDEQAKV